MDYDKDKLLNLLDKPTIIAIMNIYDLKLKHLAGRFGVSKPGIKYHIDRDSFKPWQKEILLDLFMDHGLDGTELILIHTITHKKKGADL